MARVYQSADGQYIVFNNDIKTFFATEAEAENMADKIKFTQQAQAWCTKLAVLFRDAPDLEGVYFDEGFHSGGGDAIEDGDISNLPGSPTAAAVSAFITAAQQLQKFDIGDTEDPVVNANYGSSINTMRTDV